MKRITAVLKESEALSERKAVCIAGAERIVITPLPYRVGGIDMMDMHSAQRTAESNNHARLDVTTADNRSGRIISAIRKIAHAGRAILASRHDRPRKHTT